MADETFVDGSDLVVYIYETSGTPAYQPIGCSTSDTLSESLEINEIETKCDPGVNVAEPLTTSYEISGEGRFVDEDVDTGRQSHKKLSGYLRNKTKVTWRRDTGIAATPYEYGYGYVTACDLTSNSGEKVTYSYTISGTGAIVTTDPNA